MFLRFQSNNFFLFNLEFPYNTQENFMISEKFNRGYSAEQNNPVNCFVIGKFCLEETKFLKTKCEMPFSTNFSREPNRVRCEKNFLGQI